MPGKVHDHLLRAYDATQDALVKIFAAIPEEQFFHQPFPGTNHALWTMGHLATVDQYFLQKVTGRDPALFEKYKTLFFAKSQPISDPGGYPPIDVVREYFNTSRAAFRSWIESLDDEKLEAPLAEDMQRVSPSVGALLFRLLWHEGMHYGQLTVIRKSLGLAPVRI